VSDRDKPPPGAGLSTDELAKIPAELRPYASTAKLPTGEAGPTDVAAAFKALKEFDEAPAPGPRPAAPSEVQTYYAAVAVPKTRDPTLEMQKIEVKVEANPRRMVTQPSTRKLSQASVAAKAAAADVVALGTAKTEPQPVAVEPPSAEAQPPTRRLPLWPALAVVALIAAVLIVARMQTRATPTSPREESATDVKTHAAAPTKGPETAAPAPATVQPDVDPEPSPVASSSATPAEVEAPSTVKRKPTPPKPSAAASATPSATPAATSKGSDRMFGTVP
jgi:hypothetical protein